MNFIFNPLYTLAVLCLLIYIGMRLGKTRRGKSFGAALIIIVLGAIAANLGIIPTASNSTSLYDGIFKYIAPFSIFLLTLDANLSKLKDAGLPMLILFVIGTLGTAIGVYIAFQIVSPESVLGKLGAPIAGMIAGTYSGGSINFNAIALHYDVMENGLLFAGTVAVDNVLTALWIIVTLAIPAAMHKIWPGKKMISPDKKINKDTSSSSHLTLNSLVVLTGTCLFSLFISEQISALMPAIPSILIVTSLALILAQIPYFHRLSGAQSYGLYAVYLFLAVIGAFCELSAVWELGAIGLKLILFLGITIIIHGVIIIIAGRLLFTDWDMIAITSQANIGGGTTAMALAETFERKELILPAIVVGTLGNALGTYVGFMVAALLI